MTMTSEPLTCGAVVVGLVCGKVRGPPHNRSICGDSILVHLSPDISVGKSHSQKTQRRHHRHQYLQHYHQQNSNINNNFLGVRIAPPSATWCD